MSRTTADWIAFFVAVTVVAIGARLLLGPRGLTVNGALVVATLVVLPVAGVIYLYRRRGAPSPDSPSLREKPADHGPRPAAPPAAPNHFCPVCGTAHLPGAAFCASCRNRLPMESPSAGVPPPVGPEGQPLAPIAQLGGPGADALAFTAPRYRGGWRVISGDLAGFKPGDDVDVLVSGAGLSLWKAGVTEHEVPLQQVSCVGDTSKVTMSFADGATVVLDWWEGEDGDRLRQELRRA